MAVEPTPTSSLPSATVTNAWSNSGNLNIARAEYTATLLPNGKVLVVGGISQGQTDSSLDWHMTASTELYDPTTGTWRSAGDLNKPRQFHTATLLPNGKVLVVGGSGSNPSSASVELYDPATNSWAITGSLNTPRWEHTATLLPNGIVLVAGGVSTSGTTANAELYDSATGIWNPTGSLNTPRFGHTATLLPNGQVLVAGGAGTSAELYDPADGVWSPTGNLHVARDDLPTATLLRSGQVLVVGGDGQTIASAEVFDPATSTWNITAEMQTNTIRNLHTATLLPDGKVLVAGGSSVVTPENYIVLASAEIYDPATGIWSLASSLNIARALHAATLLPNGQVLVAGGFDGRVFLKNAELYSPAPSP